MSGRTILVWFRNDLRIHDNEILLEAVNRADKVVPVFCFDPRYFATTEYNTRKTGQFRARFLLDSVAGLRDSLRALGGDLLIKTGLAEVVLPQICKKYSVSEVYHHREVAAEETEISGLVEAALWKQQINLKHFIGHTLYHKEDLPFPIKDIPDAFKIFRKKLVRDSSVRPVFDTPAKITVPVDMETSELPSLADFEIIEKPLDERAQFLFVGGEQEGLQHLQKALAQHISHSGKNIRNINSSTSLLSPWLSLGCLSPREIYWQIKEYEKDHGSNDFTSRIILELQWRDYFRFMLKKHGSKITDISEQEEMSLVSNQAYCRWKSGTTGIALLDACMTELNSTGYINNICRQYVALYLIKNLKINWKAGAAYFAEKLIDYSPASNWGNWTYLAGEGVLNANIPVGIKENLFFEEQYINKWLPKSIKA